MLSRRSLIASAALLVAALASISSIRAASGSGTPTHAGKGKGTIVLPTPANDGELNGAFKDAIGGQNFIVDATTIFQGAQQGVGMHGTIHGDAIALSTTGPAATPFAEVHGHFTANTSGDGKFKLAIVIPSSTAGQPPQKIGEIHGKLKHVGLNGKWKALFAIP